MREAGELLVRDSGIELVVSVVEKGWSFNGAAVYGTQVVCSDGSFTESVAPTGTEEREFELFTSGFFDWDDDDDDCYDDDDVPW